MYVFEKSFGSIFSFKQVWLNKIESLLFWSLFFFSFLFDESLWGFLGFFVFGFFWFFIFLRGKILNKILEEKK